MKKAKKRTSKPRPRKTNIIQFRADDETVKTLDRLVNECRKAFKGVAFTRTDLITVAIDRLSLNLRPLTVSADIEFIKKRRGK